jgi:hypothetical protein
LRRFFISLAAIRISPTHFHYVNRPNIHPMIARPANVRLSNTTSVDFNRTHVYSQPTTDVALIWVGIAVKVPSGYR